MLYSDLPNWSLQPLKRVALTDEQVDWSVELDDYAPQDYTAPYVLTHGPDCPIKGDFKVPSHHVCQAVY